MTDEAPTRRQQLVTVASTGLLLIALAGYHALLLNMACVNLHVAKPALWAFAAWGAAGVFLQLKIHADVRRVAGPPFVMIVSLLLHYWMAACAAGLLSLCP